MRTHTMTIFSGFCSAAVLLAAANSSIAALVVTPENTGAGLASVIQGPGITINPLSITYAGATNQSGTFTGGVSAGIGNENGIILTSEVLCPRPAPLPGITAAMAQPPK